MTVHALVTPCAEPRERCFALCIQNVKQPKFSGLRPLAPLGGAYSAPADSLAAQRFFSSLRSLTNRHPKKIAGYGTGNICLFRNFIVLSIIAANQRRICLGCFRRLFEGGAHLKVQQKSAALARSNLYSLKFNNTNRTMGEIRSKLKLVSAIFYQIFIFS